jgi:hypothetical protein
MEWTIEMTSSFVALLSYHYCLYSTEVICMISKFSELRNDIALALLNASLEIDTGDFLFGY